jgi:hypothetical protein
MRSAPLRSSARQTWCAAPALRRRAPRRPRPLPPARTHSWCSEFSTSRGSRNRDGGRPTRAARRRRAPRAPDGSAGGPVLWSSIGERPLLSILGRIGWGGQKRQLQAGLKARHHEWLDGAIEAPVEAGLLACESDCRGGRPSALRIGLPWRQGFSLESGCCGGRALASNRTAVEAGLQPCKSRRAKYDPRQ